ncbi:MAG: tetratricopeptide repeat protein [Proteobacteria bacterium]|nr:tetratricopeptide repeat protein [Pseudomonadota bacterium]
MIRAAGLAILFLAAWTPITQADFTQNIRRCDSDGAHPDIRIAACTRNIQSGRFTGGNLAVAFTNRGLAYKRKGQWDRAIADYSEAIRLKSDVAQVFNNRGNAYYYKGQLDRALKDYDDAIRLQPDLAEAFSNRGNVYRKKGRFDRAIEEYDRAIRFSPDNAQVFADRGLAYEKKGESSRALRDFEKAYALGFRHPLLLKKLREGGVPL